jgi:hypothetical protein
MRYYRVTVRGEQYTSKGEVLDISETQNMDLSMRKTLDLQFQVEIDVRETFSLTVTSLEIELLQKHFFNQGENRYKYTFLWKVLNVTQKDYAARGKRYADVLSSIFNNF